MRSEAGVKTRSGAIVYRECSALRPDRAVVVGFRRYEVCSLRSIEDCRYDASNDCSSYDELVRVA